MALQTEGLAKTSYSGVVDALRKIAAKEGSLALYQGIGVTQNHYVRLLIHKYWCRCNAGWGRALRQFKIWDI